MPSSGRASLSLLSLLALTLVPDLAGADGVAGSPPLPWRLSTSSPDPMETSGTETALYRLCGDADAGLADLAARNAGRQLRGEQPFASDELGFTLRTTGSPEVWPRAWSMEGQNLDQEEIEKRVGEWSNGMRALGTKRCGVSRSMSRGGKEVVSLVQVDALADLEPLPTLTRVSQWVTIKGHMLVSASDAKVVLLGPRGLPKTILANLTGDDIRATFSVDAPGTWLIQVLATVSTGPRPVLEAYIHAGVDAPDRFQEAPAPGEDAGTSGQDERGRLLAMVNAARDAEGLPPLVGNSSLDALAMAHSKLMLDKKTVGHDVGDGDPYARLSQAGLASRATGENVAAASSVSRAHRALWASPSHRQNILEKRFANVGIGIVQSADGRAWVTELFSSGS